MISLAAAAPSGLRAVAATYARVYVGCFTFAGIMNLLKVFLI